MKKLEGSLLTAGLIALFVVRSCSYDVGFGVRDLSHPRKDLTIFPEELSLTHYGHAPI